MRKNPSNCCYCNSNLYILGGDTDADLFENGYIVTMGADETVYDGGGVLVESDKIVAEGKVDPKLVKPDAEVIDLQGKYVLPGFVNTHVHTSQQISRGVGDDVEKGQIIDPVLEVIG